MGMPMHASSLAETTAFVAVVELKQFHPCSGSSAGGFVAYQRIICSLELVVDPNSGICRPLARAVREI
jgi:hypothetical protein